LYWSRFSSFANGPSPVLNSKAEKSVACGSSPPKMPIFGE
jgi:hypothetical protein